tara:strand:+ start:124324 stop:126102 length:1779 start_codon:yes stop_codon:yes gene_type:complete
MIKTRRLRSFRGLRTLVCGGLILGTSSALMADPFANQFPDPDPRVTRAFSEEASSARSEGSGDEQRHVGPARLTGQLAPFEVDTVTKPHDEYLIDLVGHYSSIPMQASDDAADGSAAAAGCRAGAGCRTGCSTDCGSWLWRVPELMGDQFRLGGAHRITFRPQVANPTAATGIVALDVAANRLVFVDNTGTMLIPGNANLVPGATFDIFRDPGGALLTPTTNAQGLTGHFGVQRLQNDVTSATTTTGTPFDVLELNTTATITDPISTAMAVSPLHTAHLRVITNTSANPGFGNVGLVKQAMGGSPLTRDRTFFHYDYFDQVNLGPGADVSRFTPGFEKLIFDDLTSIELRAPFASTLDSDININRSTSSNEVEFGDITLALKRVLAQGDSWLVSAGLQVSLPTADDLKYSVTDGTSTGEFLRLENDSVHLMPFLGAVLTPCSRSFLQAFVQLDVDASGRPVLTNANALNGGSLSQVGTLNDAAFLYVDVNTGFWLVQEPEDSSATITGIAPMVELNYNASVSNSDQVTFLPLGTIGQRGRDVEFLNATIGCVFELHHSSNVTVGYSVPLAGGSDEEYDGHLRVMFTQRFGAR